MWNIWNMLYPDVCPFCGKVHAEIICDDCRKKIIRTEEPICKKCGKPIGKEQAEYCGDCKVRMEESACWFECGRSMWIHRPPVNESIYQFKFHNRRVYGQYFAKEMADRFAKWIRKNKIEVLIPIPMDHKKKRKRGYNQAEILALELGKRLHLPVDGKLLRKKRITTAQKTLTRSEREKNLQGSFRVEYQKKLPNHVLLIDDIYTTGNTINEAAKMLKKAGVERVFFLTISIGQDI